jgi:hypothetical protein
MKFTVRKHANSTRTEHTAFGPGSFGKNQGVNVSMTWTSKVVRVALAISVVGALALAMGANFYDGWWWIFW